MQKPILELHILTTRPLPDLILCKHNIQDNTNIAQNSSWLQDCNSPFQLELLADHYRLDDRGKAHNLKYIGLIPAECKHHFD